MNDIFLELSIVISLAAGVSIVMRLMRQPLIIGYILTGTIIGPFLLQNDESREVIDGLGEFGIALLLFIIGLGLNPKVIKEVGKVAVLTGVGQVAIMTALGWPLARMLGYDAVTSLQISVALAFSSTIVILKLLSDKKEQQRLYGKIAIGFLLVQDILATIALIAASASKGDGFSAADMTLLMGKGLGLGLILYCVVKYVLPIIKNTISGSQEVLFIFSVAWGFGIASIFKESGFSLEIGALAAGIALATQTFATEVGSRLRPLRDFFIILFFVTLGTHIEVGSTLPLLPKALLLSAFVLIVTPIVILTIMGLLGFKRKTSFKTGMAVAQISEFSLVFILLAADSSDSEVVRLITLIALITITLSSYMIIYTDQLYARFEKYLGVFERKHTRAESDKDDNAELILIGYKKGGEQFIKTFKSMKKRYLVLDYDPNIIEKLDHDGIPNVYGDITDIELLAELNIDKAKLVISMMSEFSANAFLAGYMSKNNPNAVVICSADTPGQATDLYAEGVNYVMMPHYIGSERIVSFIKKSGLKRAAFKDYKNKHLLRLQSEYSEHYSETRKKRGFGHAVLAGMPGSNAKKSKKSSKK